MCVRVRAKLVCQEPLHSEGSPSPAWAQNRAHMAQTEPVSSATGPRSPLR